MGGHHDGLHRRASSFRQSHLHYGCSRPPVQVSPFGTSLTSLHGKSVASKFIDFIVKLHGIPKSIISDRDPVFISAFWRELWCLSGTKLRMSSAYHPQTDGQTEVVNRCVEQFLRCFVHSRPKQWSYLLPWTEYWYNTTYHSSIRMTSFKALYGRDPPTLLRYDAGSTPIVEFDEQLAERDELLLDLKRHLDAA